MNKHIAFPVFIALAVLLTYSYPAFGAENQVDGSYKENFKDVGGLNTKATTANINTDDGTVTLPYTVSVSRLGSNDGVPTITLYSFNATDNTWLLVGYILQPPANTIIAKIWKYDGITFTDLSSAVEGYHSGLTAIGSNGSYWLIGGPGKLLKYDGTIFTDLSSEYSAVFSGGAYSIQWNGAVWMFTGGTNGLGTYDGSAFTNLSSLATLPSAYSQAAWNSGKKQWLIAFQEELSTLYSYDGEKLNKISSPSYLGNITHVASDGRVWLLTGWDTVRQGYTTFLFDGKKFTDLSKTFSLWKTIGWSNIAWNGKYWILRSDNNNGQLPRIYTLGRKGTGLRQLSVDLGATDFQYGNSEVVPLNNGWVIAGNTFGTSNEAFFLRGIDTYLTGKKVESKTVVKSTENIALAKIRASSTLPEGTSIKFWLSNNDGKKWREVESGSWVMFSTSGKQLKWRAVLSTTDTSVTPSLKGITLYYSTGKLEKFTETFATTKFKDREKTTADWNTSEKLGQLLLVTRNTVWDSSKGFPLAEANSVGAYGGTVMAGGGSGRLIQIHDQKITELTSLLPSSSNAITAIGANGSYWLIGSARRMYKYDGTNITDLSSEFSAVADGWPYTIAWNGSYWLIGGSGSVVKYDGSQFTNMATVFPGLLNITHIAWNGSKWLIADSYGKMFLYDGVVATTVTGPFSGFNSVFSIAAHDGQWLLGGAMGGKAKLYLFDGLKFTNYSSVVSGALINSVIWGGQNWVVASSTSSTIGSGAKVFTINQTGKLLNTDTYSAKTGYSIYSDAAAQTSTGWVMAGYHSSSGMVLMGEQIYKTSGVLQSTTINKDTTKSVIGVELIGTDTIPDGTTITYRVSQNQGRTWSTVTPGTIVKFTGTGKDLRWQAKLRTSNSIITPSIRKIILRYIVR